MSQLTSPRNRIQSTLHRDADRVVLEQAKGALMLRYGIGSREAFAVLLAWSRQSNTTLHTIAHTLVTAVHHGDVAEHHEPSLVRWLQDQVSEDITAHL